MCRQLNKYDLTELKVNFLQLIFSDKLYGRALFDMDVRNHRKNLMMKFNGFSKK